MPVRIAEKRGQLPGRITSAQPAERPDGMHPHHGDAIRESRLRRSHAAAAADDCQRFERGLPNERMGIGRERQERWTYPVNAPRIASGAKHPRAPFRRIGAKRPHEIEDVSLDRFQTGHDTRAGVAAGAECRHQERTSASIADSAEHHDRCSHDDRIVIVEGAASRGSQARAGSPSASRRRAAIRLHRFRSR